MLRTTCGIAALAALIHAAPLPGAGAQTTTTTLADVRYLAPEDGAPPRVTCTVHRPHGWWVLDLAGSVWERAVTIGHPRGRAFRGTHGDGYLSTYGNATNEDWPRGDDDGGGYGYRGGGYYDPEHQGNAFLPHSPIGYRRFGAWGSAPRYKAYGFRCARTAP